jgi:hypothetical protein
MVLIITQILGGNLGKSNVGFRHLNLTYKISDRTTRSAITLKMNTELDKESKGEFQFIAQLIA